jgi:hypothetical protein
MLIVVAAVYLRSPLRRLNEEAPGGIGAL